MGSFGPMTSAAVVHICTDARLTHGMTLLQLPSRGFKTDGQRYNILHNAMDMLCKHLSLRLLSA